ncbi:MAG: AAA family ATPase, partial [Bacteroidales bacterium]|nr:AAA family ATPase [Bacteroidales bacterium]
TQGDTQDKTLDIWIEEQIRNNLKITTEELAKLSGRSVITIKRHISKLSHIKYVGSGYSGHWEIVD